MPEILGSEEFLSSKEAGERFGYSSDYVARLARTGKILGKKVGKTWFVQERSLIDFLKDYRVRQNGRLSTLQRERVKEYKKINGSAFPFKTVVVFVFALFFLLGATMFAMSPDA